MVPRMLYVANNHSIVIWRDVALPDKGLRVTIRYHWQTHFRHYFQTDLNDIYASIVGRGNLDNSNIETLRLWLCPLLALGSTIRIGLCKGGRGIPREKKCTT